MLSPPNRKKYAHCQCNFNPFLPRNAGVAFKEPKSSEKNLHKQNSCRERTHSSVFRLPWLPCFFSIICFSSTQKRAAIRQRYECVCCVCAPLHKRRDSLSQQVSSLSLFSHNSSCWLVVLCDFIFMFLYKMIMIK